MLVHFLVLQRNCIRLQCLYELFFFAYTYLWYTWVFWVHNTTFIPMQLFRPPIVVFGKSLLNMLTGIKLPSLPVSTLYSHSVFCYFLFLAVYLLLIPCYGSWNFFSYHIKVSCWHLCLFIILECLMSCFVLFSISLVISLLGFLYTFSQWFWCPQLEQLFPNSTHLRGSFMVLQYLQLCSGLLLYFFLL